MKSIAVKYVFWIGILLAASVRAGISFWSADLLDTLFQPARNVWQLLDNGIGVQQVGNEIVRWSTNFPLSSWGNAPLIVRITKMLLRVVIALSIPVLIYIGVKIIRESGVKWKSVQESLWDIKFVLIWLVLALSAVGIIYLIQSLVFNTLPTSF